MEIEIGTIMRMKRKIRTHRTYTHTNPNMRSSGERKRDIERREKKNQQ